MDKGDTWVYSYDAYEPTASDPNKIIKATYRLTETIVETKTAPSDFIAHVKKDYQLINSDEGWTGNIVANQPNESWYIVNGQQIFDSKQPVDIKNVTTENLILAYDFPLIVNKAWCLIRFDLKDPSHKPITECQSVNQRAVTNQGSYESSAGKFDNCYNLVDYSNGGNIFQKFCIGVGIVSMKFDHAGTRFGFEQTLIRYSLGGR